ncbi:MAG: 2-C-methyl-D-erythritol 2,4-cyclodiphosphate synthase [Planctomycetota bacterium]
MIRVGLGYDFHRLVEGRRLVLGGIEIPHEKGLLGHSDADVVLHAVIDAFLGAANLGDIGDLFPDDDAAFKDADSRELLKVAMAKVGAAGWKAANIDLNVLAERPKLKPYKEAMRASIADLIGLEVDAVSVKAKTREGLGDVGRGEAIEVHCVVLLSKV